MIQRGIRKTSDEIEQIGVEKTINITNAAELILAVFDDSRAFDEEDEKILNLINNKNAIIIINKIDLNKNFIRNNNQIKFRKKKIIEISTTEEKSIEKLYKAIQDIFNFQEIDYEDSEIITNTRQKQYILLAKEELKKAYTSMKNAMPVDIISIYLREILEQLSRITGENVTDDIINEIFSKFCLGK